MGFFAVEAALKITGDGPRAYFTGWASCFDFFLVFGSFCDLLLARVDDASLLLLLRIFRVFRVSRLLRLLGPSSTFRSLLKVLVYSLPSIYNIGAILFMIYFVYAIFGMNVFCDTKFDVMSGNFTGDLSDGINEDANFRSFTSGEDLNTNANAYSFLALPFAPSFTLSLLLHSFAQSSSLPHSSCHLYTQHS